MKLFLSLFQFATLLDVNKENEETEKKCKKRNKNQERLKLDSTLEEWRLPSFKNALMEFSNMDATNKFQMIEGVSKGLNSVSLKLKK